MVWDLSGSENIPSAIVRVISGEVKCDICYFVEEAKELEENKDHKQPKVKLDTLTSQKTVLYVIQHSKALSHFHYKELRPSQTDSPPSPPPRSFS